MGWTGFNGGDPFAANVDSSMERYGFSKRFFYLLVFIGLTGLVQGWAALVMDIASGTIPWYTMMSLSRNLTILQKIDDTLGVFHTLAIAGTLGGALTGLFAHLIQAFVACF